MPEYIDRDYVRKFATYTHRKSGVEPIKVVPLKFIEDVPAADVEPVRHGRWEGEGDGYAETEGGEMALVYDVWICNQCGHTIDDGTDDPSLLPKYCPNCGAKMDGEAQ